jgi:hypothetical protein
MTNFIDMTGRKYGKLTVVKKVRKASNGDTIWLCLCECGKETEVFGGNLRRKNRSTQSCGDCLRFIPQVYKETNYGLRGNGFIDITGQIFGRLTVVTLAGYNKDNKYVWTCKCSCGNQKDIVGNVLRDGRVTSCGCYRIEQMSIAPGQAEINSLFLDYQNGAKERGYEFSLTKKQFEKMIKENCFYCGVSPSRFKKNAKNSKGIYFNGIDRIENSKGYSVKNSVPCCFDCNRSKGTMSQKDFLNWIKRCYIFLFDKN